MTKIRSEVTSMKEFRGAEAVRYARETGIYFDIDEDYLADAEEGIRGRHTSMVDVDELIEEQMGRPYDPAEILPGNEVFDFLINRYGDGWIYVALEGNNPEAEERVTLRLFRRLLEEKEPASASDVSELLRKYARLRLGDTGFPRDADLNLLFHAALRLSDKGLLLAVDDPDPLPQGQTSSYGCRRFVVPPDMEVSLAGVLCERCRRERLTPPLSLHRECARRLRKALAEAAARV